MEIKIKSITGWDIENNKSFSGSNESGFNALPIGIRTADYKYGKGGEFDLKGNECIYWSSTIDNNIYSDGFMGSGFSSGVSKTNYLLHLRNRIHMNSNNLSDFICFISLF